MISQVKGLVLLSLINISVVGSKVPLALNDTKHETFSFWHHINKMHKQINQLAVTAKIFSHPGIQLCAIFSWAACETSLACSTFMNHMNTEHTFDSPEIRNKFSYIMVQLTHHRASKYLSV